MAEVLTTQAGGWARGRIMMAEKRSEEQRTATLSAAAIRRTSRVVGRSSAAHRLQALVHMCARTHTHTSVTEIMDGGWLPNAATGFFITLCFFLSFRAFADVGR